MYRSFKICLSTRYSTYKVLRQLTRPVVTNFIFPIRFNTCCYLFHTFTYSFILQKYFLSVCMSFCTYLVTYLSKMLFIKHWYIHWYAINSFLIGGKLDDWFSLCYLYQSKINPTEQLVLYKAFAQISFVISTWYTCVLNWSLL